MAAQSKHRAEPLAPVGCWILVLALLGSCPQTLGWTSCPIDAFVLVTSVQGHHLSAQE